MESLKVPVCSGRELLLCLLSVAGCRHTAVLQGGVKVLGVESRKLLRLDWVRVTFLILKKCLKINWFSVPQLYPAEARKKSQDRGFPTVTPFISGKLSHLMMI